MPVCVCVTIKHCSKQNSTNVTNTIPLTLVSAVPDLAPMENRTNKTSAQWLKQSPGCITPRWKTKTQKEKLILKELIYVICVCVCVCAYFCVLEENHEACMNYAAAQDMPIRMFRHLSTVRNKMTTTFLQELLTLCIPCVPI